MIDAIFTLVIDIIFFFCYNIFCTDYGGELWVKESLLSKNKLEELN